MNASASSPVPCAKLRILVTDDEAGVREVFRLILASGLPHCTIDVATNGLEAVQAFRAHHHALLLLDMKMPVMDGQTAFYKISDVCDERGWEHPIVIFCTGYALTPALQSATGGGHGHCLLQKPVTGETLLATVRAHLPPA